MLRTRLCDLLEIEVSIVQGPLGSPWPPSVELVAAVSEAGGLGSLPTALRSAMQVTAMREGHGLEFVPLTGQSAGLVGEVRPAAEIVRRMAEEAEAALRQAPRFAS